jgi:Uma2 family endonuclease
MTVTSASPKTIPPLQPGDRLSRDEFERRYHAMPGVKKAELIEGEVYMASPVSYQNHVKQDIHLGGLLFLYSSQTPGVSSGNNATILLDSGNEPQPDQVLFIEPANGGRITINGDGYIDGSPELVVEISGTTAGIDMGKKREVYRRNDVKEYIVWRVYDDEIDWFALQGEEWITLSPVEGILKSNVFPGLWLNLQALFADDKKASIATLNQGLASPEHAEFVTRLSQALKS